MAEKSSWQLQHGIKMAPETAEEVAKIACALKSLSIYAGLVIEREDCPSDLQQIVDDGVKAIDKVFIW